MSIIEKMSRPHPFNLAIKKARVLANIPGLLFLEIP
jgi:hypothetical protein